MARNQFIDNLRGVSVLGVSLFHVFLIWNNLNIYVWKTSSDLSWFSDFFLNFGHYGVDIFFTLSGFLIAQSLSNNSDIKYFYVKRFVRIFPIYYSMYFLNILMFLAASGEMSKSIGLEISYNWHIENMFYYLGFLASYRPHFGPDFVGHFWSLAVEEHFYLLFPGLLLVFKKRIGPISIICFLALIGWRGIVCFTDEEVFYNVIYHNSHFRMAGIMMGVILFYYFDWFKKPILLFGFLTSATIFYWFYDSLGPGQSYSSETAELSMIMTEWLKPFVPSLGTMFLVSMCYDFKSKVRFLRINEFIGKASLSFYVMSYIVNMFFSAVFTAGPVNFYLYFSLVIFFTFLFSWLSYLFFEKWLYLKVTRSDFARSRRSY